MREVSKVDDTRLMRELVAFSDDIYRAGDRETKQGETRHRRGLILGCFTLAEALEQTSEQRSFELSAGAMLEQLRLGGLTPDTPSLQAFPEFQDLHTNLLNQKNPHFYKPNDAFTKEILMRYADTERRTMTRTGEFETDSSHAVHLGTWATAFAMREHPDLNPAKLVALSQVHDIAEWWYGDTPTFEISQSQLNDKTTKEQIALYALNICLGNKYPKLLRLIEEYEEQTSDEARFTRLADKVDADLSHFTNDGEALLQLYDIDTREKYDYAIDCLNQRNSKYAPASPILWRTHHQLTEQTAIDMQLKQAA